MSSVSTSTDQSDVCTSSWCYLKSDEGNNSGVKDETNDKKTYCHFVSIFFMTLTLKHIQKVKALETQEMCKSFFF